MAEDYQSARVMQTSARIAAARISNDKKNEHSYGLEVCQLCRPLTAKASQGALASDFKLGHYPSANEFRNSNSPLSD
jgi:hypothetical protein